MSEFRQHFLADSIEKLNGLRMRFAESPVDHAIRELVRIFHTIKGGGRMFAIPSAGEFAAFAENTLHNQPTRRDCVEMIDRMLAILRGGETFEPDLSSSAQSPKVVFADIPRAVFRELESAEKDRIVRLLARSDNLLGGVLSFECENFVRDFACFRSGLRHGVETVAMVPQEVEPSQKSFFVFLESDSETAIETAFGVLSPVSCEKSKDETLAALFGATVLEIELLAESLGKKIDTTIISNNLEPDEKLRQGLATILIHLVRNSVDHGIADRGRIEIALFSEPGVVRLLVADDGRGIDSDELRKRAAKIIANRALPDDIFELISTAGLSTSVAVTDISGRGVGLDVVREQIAALNGKISVENRKSDGVFFEIAIPVGPAETNE